MKPSSPFCMSPLALNSRTFFFMSSGLMGSPMPRSTALFGPSFMLTHTLSLRSWKYFWLLQLQGTRWMLP